METQRTRDAQDRRLVRRLRQQAAVAEVSRRALGNGPIADVIQLAARRITDLLPLDHCIGLEIRPGGKVRVVAGYPVGSARYDESLDLPDGVLRRALETGESQQAPGPPSAEERMLLSGAPDAPSGYLLVLPVLTARGPWGLLCMTAATKARVGDEDLQFLQLLVEAIAACVELAVERHGQARFRGLLDKTSDAVAIIDPRGVPEYLNPAARAMLELPESRDVMEAPAYIPDDYQAYFREVILPVLRARDNWSGDVTLRAHSGREWHLSQVVVAHRDDRGRVERYSTIARDRTQETLRTRNLRKRELQLERAQALSRIMTNRLSLDGYWLRVAPQFCRLLGYSEREMVGRHYSDVTWHDELETHRRALTILRRGRMRSIDTEKRYVHRDGRVIWVELNVTVVNTPDGRPGYLLCHVLDITERKQIQQALAYRSSFLEIIADLSGRFICAPVQELDAEVDHALGVIGRHADVDRTYLMQFSAEDGSFHCTHEWCGSGVKPAIHELRPVPLDQFGWLVERSRRGEIVSLADIENLPEEAATDREGLRGRSTRSLLLSPLLVGEQVIGAVGMDVIREKRTWTRDMELMLGLAGQMLLNVFHRRRMDQALADSEQRYRVLVENAAEGILVYDLETGQYIDANRNALELLAVDRHTLLASPPERFLPATQPDGSPSAVRAVELIDRAVRGEQLVVEWTYLAADGREVPTELRLVRLPAAGRNLVRGSILDLTDRKRAEKHLLDERYFTDSTINSLPGIFYLCDERGQLCRWNRRLEEITGLTGSALESMRLQDLFTAAERPMVWRRLQQLLKTGEGSVEAGLVASGGSVVPYLLTGVRSESEGAQYLVGTGMDVTERHTAEQERMAYLRRTRQQHQTIGRVATSSAVAEGDLEAVYGEVALRLAEALETSRASVWLFNEEQTLLRCAELYSTEESLRESGHALDMMKLPSYLRALQEGVGIDAVDVEHDPRTRELFNDYLRPRDIRSLLDAPIRVSGRVMGVVCVEEVGARRQWTADEVTFVGAMADQIAQALINRERRQSAQALRESERRYRVLYDHNPSMFFTVDSMGFVRSVNRFAAETLDRSVEDLVGVPFDTLHVEEDQAQVDAWVSDCIDAGGTLRRWDTRLARGGDNPLWIRVTARSIQEADDVPVMLAVCEDITEARKLSEELSYQASHDSLTGLYNRREFEQRLERALQGARMGGDDHALLYLDLDQFKVINDTCGHIAGDELLRQLSDVLRSRVSKRDTLARLGGDEFGVLLEHCAPDNARRVAEAVRTAIAEFRFSWGGQTFGLGVSIGLVPITATSSSINDILSLADTACYAAKDQGRNRIHTYREDDSELARRHGEMQWVNRIRHALDESRFRLYYQRIVPLAAETGASSMHYELLMRMLDETGAVVPPNAFLPAAERYNLASRLDRWVVSEALSWLSARPEHLRKLGTCSINLSGHTMGEDDFLDFVLAEIRNAGIPADRLCFEITETAAIRNLSTAARFIRRLKDQGCRFALDDFGSGLSSFAYLKNLPVDYLKIDGVFVKDIADDPIDLAVVKSINDIGHVMGKQTIAEFVESRAIMETLRGIGVDFAQGYEIGAPESLDTLGPDKPAGDPGRP